ncbi:MULTISPECIES: hypothetical protein [Listeria]|uniref:WDGH domain-containing protein n=1 Tax=Listeria TaxID=1637 RepID=UPI001FC953BA|nr:MULTISPECIES: hypothetical protein [Listeria]
MGGVLLAVLNAIVAVIALTYIAKYVKSEKERKEQVNESTESINEQIANLDDKSNISDGSHTFDDLYFHRMILFSIICNQHPDLAFKSKVHFDGSKFHNYFICGIKTQEGWYTYHYQNIYWDYFKVPEFDRAPEWDGHTSYEITRLLSLEVESE